MSSHIGKLSEALNLLSLGEDCTLEELKASYKQHALRTHPDKNPGNPEATAEFQRVGEAYKIIETHLERPKFLRSGYYTEEFDPFFTEVDAEDVEGFFHDYSDSDDYEYDDSDDDSSSEHAYYGMPRSYMDYLFLFEAINSGHYRCKCPRHRRTREEEYQARLKRSREEQLAAEARRAAEAATLKELRAKERDQERAEAERRQKLKAEQKKAQAQARRKKAQEAVRAQHRRTQELRSAVFAAARQGDVEKVKNGIWKDGVDAAGGEVKYQEFVRSPPGDPLETLLHIAAKNGNVELFHWLDDHNAELDERDSKGYTALHFAIYHGHIPIVKHVFESYPSKEPEHKHIYDTPSASSLLQLAIRSGEPELVWMVLENSLFNSQDMSSALSWAKQAVDKDRGSSDCGSHKYSDILRLLVRYDETTPSSSSAPEAVRSQKDYGDPDEFETQTKRSNRRKGQGRGLCQRGAKPNRHEEKEDRVKSEQVPSFNRGRGRSRGKGRGQGYSRGRGGNRGHARQTSS